MTNAATWTWQNTETGYRASDGRAELNRGPRKSWTLTLRDGRQFAMPKKASFDHAEAILTREGAL